MILFRVDGNNSIGMGHIFSSINMAKKLENFEILFVSKYEEGISKIKEFNYKTKKIPEDISLEEEIKIIKEINKNFKIDIIIIDLLIKDYSKYCKEISKINKSLVIDYFGDIEVYSDILINFDILPENQNYIKKNRNTIYCLGPKYALLNEKVNKYHNLNKTIKDKITNVLITTGGSDPKDLTPRILDILKDFKEIKFNIVIGHAFKNKVEIKKGLDSRNINYKLIENSNNLSELMYNSDLAISTGGLTSLELSAIGTPFIGISSAVWESKRLKKMEEYGICKYIESFYGFKKENLYKIFKELINNKREIMSSNGKRLLDGNGMDRIIERIRSVIKNGNKTN